MNQPPQFYECQLSATPARPYGITLWSKPALEPVEIKRVIELCDKGPLQAAEVGQLRDGRQVELQDDTQRASLIGGIELNDTTRWLYERLTQIARNLNTEFYGFDVTGVEPLQYAVYDAQRGGHFDWHCDIGGKRYDRKRKLTMIVQLWLVKKAPGWLVAFPSFTMHRVAPVTKGVRRSLTCWAAGPSFR